MSIIEQIARDPEYKKICRNIAGGHHSWEDLYQNLLLKVISLPEAKLQKMKREGGLRFYLITIAVHDWRRANQAERIKEVPVPEIDTSEEYDEDREHRAEKLKENLAKALEEMYWYDREVFIAVSDLGSILKLSQQTGIPYKSLWKKYHEIKKHLKSKIKC